MGLNARKGLFAIGFAISLVAGVPVRTQGIGDLNGDGKIDLRDAVVMVRVAVGAIPASDAMKKAGDVNGDGALDLKDAALILQAAIGVKKLPAVSQALAVLIEGKPGQGSPDAPLAMVEFLDYR